MRANSPQEVVIPGQVAACVNFPSTPRAYYCPVTVARLTTWSLHVYHSVINGRRRHAWVHRPVRSCGCRPRPVPVRTVPNHSRTGTFSSIHAPTRAISVPPAAVETTASTPRVFRSQKSIFRYRKSSDGECERIMDATHPPLDDLGVPKLWQHSKYRIYGPA